MKVGILDKDEYENTGIDTFMSNVNRFLINNFSDSERIEYEGICDSYPFSRTVEKFTIKRRLENKVQGFDRVFVPSQTMMWMDPNGVDAEIVPYVHDILPATSCYKSYSDDSVSSRLSGYLSSVMATRYVKFLANCNRVIAASDYSRREVLRRTAFSGDASVVRQGVDHLPERKEVDRDIDLLYVGSLLERKNPEFLRNCFKAAEQAGFNVAWVNYRELDLPGTGFVNVSDKQLAEIYSRSRFYLHGSLNEGVGRGPLEAQRFGCVPLSRPIPTSQEFLGEDGVSWYSVKSVEDVLRALGSASVESRRRAIENSDKYKWEDTRRMLAEVLFK